jgi:acyl-CoA dehydrogenase
MDFTIPEEYRALKRVARRFVQEECVPLEEEIDRKDEFPRELMEKMAKKAVDIGLYALDQPVEYGGGGQGLMCRVMIAEEFGRTIDAFALLYSGGDSMIARYGTPEQKEKYLRPLCNGEMFTAIGMTEPDAGSDVASIQTTADKDGDNYIINGSKRFTTWGDKADMIKVWAVTDKVKRAKGGISCFLVPTDTPGFKVSKIQETMGNRGMHQCEEVFENCVVPAESMLGNEGEGLTIFGKSYAEGRGRHGGRAIGTAEMLLEMCRDYANIRVQFGKPIAERQFIQGMIADMAIDIYATRMLTYNFAWKYDQGLDVRHESSMVKVFFSEMLCRVTDRAMQVHGGIGYTTELPIERIYRDVRLRRIAGGTNEIQRYIIARNILRKNIPVGEISELA